MKLPVVALVGRPNVGKSTVFNRLVGSKIAIIEDTPGVTRDRIYGTVNYNNYKFHLIDTGGIEISNEEFNKQIKMQAEIAIKEADLVLFIVDGKDGITSTDRVIGEMLIKSGKNVIVAINKMDSKIAEDNKYDFYELGFDNYIEISAEHNTGFGSLKEAIVNSGFREITNEDEDNKIKFCVIGRPNVGKSSLIMLF